jgi:FAD-dependent urate hydroxylase
VSADDILIIGAGPYGLSISAHLRGLGVDHRIVGRPLDTWRAHMPIGMNLKSEPYASGLSAPQRGYDIGDYHGQAGLPWASRAGFVFLERFLSYGDWFTEQVVPDVEDVRVTEVAATGSGFAVTFADADPVTARQVVVATGVLPFATIPPEFAGLPADLVSHSSDLHRLDHFRDRRVAVLGAGQSALESAALLHEAGAEVLLIARRPEIYWNEPNPEHVSALGQLRWPVTRLCEGWRCAIWNFPTPFQRLPQDIRVRLAVAILGPSGSWWLKARVQGVVETVTSCRVAAAQPAGRGLRLQLQGAQRSSVEVDHVVAATGFPVDLDRLTFLQAGLRAQVRTANRYPLVNRAGESSVRGLYFAGAQTAVSLGPVMRFMAGTHKVASHLARSLACQPGSQPTGRPEDRALEPAAE